MGMIIRIMMMMMIPNNAYNDGYSNVATQKLGLVTSSISSISIEISISIDINIDIYIRISITNVNAPW